jgi:spore coat protein U-like protein
VTPARSLLLASVAVILLIGARPTAGGEQFPRGLMSAAPTAGGNRTCAIEVRPVSFGTYDALSGADTHAVGQVIYVCGNLSSSTLAQGNKAIRVELETGGASTFERRMTAGTGQDYLDYNLYLDATHRTIWGNGFAGTDVYVDNQPPNRTPVIVPIYGKIPGGQDVRVGQYFDSLLARIVF